MKLKPFVKKFLDKNPKVEFAAAFAVAAGYEFGQKFKKLKEGLETIGEVSPALEKARVESCQKCPIYYEPLGTCGSPLKKDERPHQGCFCHIKTKAKTKANCWAYEESKGESASLGLGWPKELNSFPYDENECAGKD